MTDPVRVVHVVTRMNIGGPARHLITLLPLLRERGFEPLLVHGMADPDEGELLPDGERVSRLPALRRPIDPLADLRALRELRRIVTRLRPRVVHTHMAKAGALGRLAAHRARVPVVVHTFHGHVLDGYFPWPVARAFLAAERSLARRTTALVAVSNAVRDELLALGIGREEQWHVVPVSLELDGLLGTPPSRAKARRSLGLPSGGKAVGVVGRLVPIKDHETFFRAAARLLRERDDVTFVVAGDGEHRRALEARARELLGDRVRFLGWVHDLAGLYAALDVVVLTSRNEGTPVSLVEAGAAGRPVVASRVGGVPEVVADGKTGILVPPADPAATAAAVRRLLDDPALARAMGEAARASLPSRFSADRLVDDLAALYDRLLGRARSR